MKRKVFCDWLSSLSALSLVGLAACQSTSPSLPPGGEDPEASGGGAGESAGGQAGEPRESAAAVTGTCPDHNPYGNLYWGELHLHTSYSLDAYSFGARADPAQAFAFAKGLEDIVIAEGSDAGPGETITQERPIDFAAMTDHSEWLSIIETCVLDEPPLGPDHGSPACNLVRSSHPAAEGLAFLFAVQNPLWPCDPAAATCEPQQTAFDRAKDAADAANEECSFSALIGYEWTDQESVDGGAATNHRNVVFSGASATVPDQPFDAAHYPTPPELWQALEAGCLPANGCDAVTIPHNTNQSSGVSLKVWDPTAAGVARQRKYQVAAEIFQHKGNSECLYDPDAPAASNDPDCEMEHTDNVTIVSANFVREALADGIEYATAHPLQGNPLQLGIVGATDTHNASPGYVDEASFKGHTGRIEVDADTRLTNQGDFNPGGITAVWAPQNTRADIFAAIKGRESYATSGPRIKLRVFQTKSLTACSDPQFPKQIVDAKKGVPMGKTFRQSNLLGSAALLAIWAFPDTWPQSLPDGTSGAALLQRVQVIKSYVDANGVAVTNAPVDVAGFPASGGCKLWQDPSFDPARRAVYYVRVLQEPTWRWSHHDCQIAANPPPECAPGGELNRTVQERAWTSPLWYVPGG